MANKHQTWMVHWSRTTPLQMLKNIRNKPAETQVCDTIKFPPKKLKIPILSSADKATKAALELIEPLKHLHDDLPYAPFSEKTITALKEIFWYLHQCNHS